MQYQVIKHLKSGTKRVGVYASIEDAKHILSKLGARFEGLSYFGCFPTFSTKEKSGKRRTYSIQGLAECGVVCSLPQKEAEACQIS